MNQQKILFERDALPREIGPTDPRFAAGECWLLLSDKAARWIRRGAARPAPEGMAAVNEPQDARQQPKLRAEDVRLRRHKGSRFHVVGPDGARFSAEPIGAAEAERLRQRVLAGDLDRPAPAPVAAPQSTLALGGARAGEPPAGGTDCGDAGLGNLEPGAPE